MVEIKRVSLVRMYYSADTTKTETPSPFAEIRVFFFTKGKLTRTQIQMLKNKLEREIGMTETLMKNFYDALQGDFIMWDDEFGEKNIRVTEKGDREIKVEIDGMEIEEIDEEELKGITNVFKRGITFDTTYRYVAFYDQEGDVRYDYNEDKISEWEVKEKIKKEKGKGKGST